MSAVDRRKRPRVSWEVALDELRALIIILESEGHSGFQLHEQVVGVDLDRPRLVEVGNACCWDYRVVDCGWLNHWRLNNWRGLHLNVGSTD